MYVRDLISLCIVFFLIGFTDSAPKVPKLPSNLIKCHRKAPSEEVNECLRLAIEDGHRKLKNGDPSINVDQLEPLTVPDIRTSQSNGPVNIKITQKNIRVTGIYKVQAKNIKLNQDKKTLYGEFYTPRIVQTADQTIDGRVLLFPITGSGKATFTSLGYRTNFTAHYKEYEKDGYHYWKFDEKTFVYKMSVEKMEFKFENLFNGDKTLGDAMNKVLNDNWRLIYSEIRPKTESTFGKVLLNALNKFFTKVPLEEVFID